MSHTTGWLDRMGRVLRFLERQATWQEVRLTLGTDHGDPAITARGTVILPGYGEIVIYRPGSGDVLFEESTFNDLLAYAGVSAPLPCLTP